MSISSSLGPIPLSHARAGGPWGLTRASWFYRVKSLSRDFISGRQEGEEHRKGGRVTGNGVHILISGQQCGWDKTFQSKGREATARAEGGQQTGQSRGGQHQVLTVTRPQPLPPICSLHKHVILLRHNSHA